MSEFTGKTLAELNALVDNTLRINHSLMTTDCELCGEPYLAHGAFDDSCPYPMRTKFRAQTRHCEAPIRTNGDGTEAVECGKDCINGSRLCKEHYDEELI